MISILGTIAATAWGLVSPLIIRHGVKVGIVAAVFAAYLANNAYHRAKGREQVVQASIKEGKKRNADAENVRKLANSPGSVRRLRDDWCRDC